MIQDFLSTHNLNIIQIVLVTIGYLMPIPLAVIALNLWHHYVQEKTILGMKWVLIEVQVPREVIKSPAAMELIFSNAFSHKARGDFWGQYIVGAVASWFSLEIVSIDGNIHFFIRMEASMKNLVETQIYSQYPQAKVIEVEDYVFDIPHFKPDGNWNVWGCEFTKDKDDFYPIKTYNDFGEDMRTGVKEEFKIDPITPTLEYLGSIPRGQQIWIQMIVRNTQKTYHSHKTGKHIGFSEASAEFIGDLIKKYAAEGQTADDSSPKPSASLPEPLRSKVESINRQINKAHFDCGIRVVTLSDKRICTDDQFQNLTRDIRLIFNQYSQKNINELKRVNTTSYDMPWHDITRQGIVKYKNRTLDFYRLRTFFNPPLQYSTDYPKVISSLFPTGSPKIFVLSSEELATLFHFPGMVSETPSFKRVESKIAKPPANLPF